MILALLSFFLLASNALTLFNYKSDVPLSSWKGKCGEANIAHARATPHYDNYGSLLEIVFVGDWVLQFWANATNLTSDTPLAVGKYTASGGRYDAGLLVRPLGVNYDLCSSVVAGDVQFPFVGEFEVLELVIRNTYYLAYVSIAIDFVQRCPNSPEALYGKLRFNSDYPFQSLKCNSVDCQLGSWSRWNQTDAGRCICSESGPVDCPEFRDRPIVVAPSSEGIPCGPTHETRTRIVPRCNSVDFASTVFKFSNWFTPPSATEPIRECGEITDTNLMTAILKTNRYSYERKQFRIEVRIKDWRMIFRAKPLDRQFRPLLSVGNYTEVHGYHSEEKSTGDSWHAGMSVSRTTSGESPYQIEGEFLVRELVFGRTDEDSRVLSLAIDFVQYSTNSSSGAKTVVEALHGQLRINSSITTAFINCNDVDCVMGPWTEWTPLQPESCWCSFSQRITCRETRTRLILGQPDAFGKKCGPTIESREREVDPCVTKLETNKAPTVFSYKQTFTNVTDGSMSLECESATEFVGADAVTKGVTVYLRGLAFEFVNKPSSRKNAYNEYDYPVPLTTGNYSCSGPNSPGYTPYIKSPWSTCRLYESWSDFHILEIVYETVDRWKILKLAIDFVLYCPGSVIRGQIRVNSIIVSEEFNCDARDCVMSQWSEWKRASDCVCSSSERVTCQETRWRDVLSQPNRLGQPCEAKNEVRDIVLPICPLGPYYVNTDSRAFLNYRIDPPRGGSSCGIITEYVDSSWRGYYYFNRPNEPLDQFLEVNAASLRIRFRAEVSNFKLDRPFVLVGNNTQFPYSSYTPQASHSIGARNSNISEYNDQQHYSEYQVLELVNNSYNIESLAIDFMIFVPYVYPWYSNNIERYTLRGYVRINSSIAAPALNCDAVDCLLGPWTQWQPVRNESCICQDATLVTCLEWRTRALLIPPNSAGKQCEAREEFRSRILSTCTANYAITAQKVFAFTYNVDREYPLLPPSTYRSPVQSEVRLLLSDCDVVSDFIAATGRGSVVTIIARDWKFRFGSKPQNGIRSNIEVGKYTTSYSTHNYGDNYNGRIEEFRSDSFLDLRFMGRPCQLGKRAVYYVSEVNYASDGTLLAFAADFVYYCDIGEYNYTTGETDSLRPQEMRGQLRFNSAIPIRQDYCYRYSDKNLGLVYTPRPTAAPTPPTNAPPTVPPTNAPTSTKPPTNAQISTKEPTSADKTSPGPMGKVASMGWMLILTIASFVPFPLCVLVAYVYYRSTKPQDYDQDVEFNFSGEDDVGLDSEDSEIDGE